MTSAYQFGNVFLDLSSIKFWWYHVKDIIWQGNLDSNNLEQTAGGPREQCSSSSGGKKFFQQND